MLHKEAQSRGLATHSCGLGELRAITVLPPAEHAPQVSERTKRVASLTHRLSRAAAEQSEDVAAPPPFSLGEIEEIVHAIEAEGTPPPEAIAACLTSVQSAIGTLPAGKGASEAAARSVRWSYERVMVVHGRAGAAASGKDHGARGGGRGEGQGRKDWRKGRPQRQRDSDQ